MISAPTPAHEAERLADLRALRVLDTPGEQRFDRIITLAARLFDVPIAYVALIDDDRQWFKARRGICSAQTGRAESFCGHAILEDEPMIVENATLDIRFADNPMVVGEPGIRFYAGVPLKGPSGYNVGTLCIADQKPRTMSEAQVESLVELAAMAEHELGLVEIIAAQHELIEAKNQLVALRERESRELNEAVAYVRSMLPPPMSEPVGIDYQFIASSQLGGDLLGYHWVRCDGEPDCHEGNKLAFYLFDVTGHGVSAALLSISVFQSIRRQTLPNTRFDDPASVLTALNRAYPMELHGNKFFTMWYGVYDPAHRTLTYASAGHPPALLFPSNTCEPVKLGDGELMIGVMPDTRYKNYTVPMPPTGRLFVYSDGAFEVRIDADRHLLGIEGLRKVLCESMHGATPDDPPLARTLAAIRKLAGADAFDDDYSMLEVRFGRSPKAG